MNRLALMAAFAALYGVPALAGELPAAEQYHLRAEYLEWRPGLQAEIRSGTFGTQVDLKDDLGMEDERTFEVRGAVQFLPGFKLRGSVTPIDYAADTRIDRAFVFDGRIYPVNARVVSSVKGNLYSAALEFDVVKNPGGYLGILLGGELFDGDASIAAPELRIDEGEDLRTPIPFLGLCGRIYASKLSFEGEISGLTLGSRGHFYEMHLGARFHVTEKIAVGVGYRLFKVQGEEEPDFVEFRQGGVTFGAELSL